MTNELQHLTLTWGISKGRDTYGYNILTLRDEHGNKYRTMGGGYDMTGTVLGDWLEANYQDRLYRLRRRAGTTWTKRNTRNTSRAANSFDGMTFDRRYDEVHLDGGYGERAMLTVAGAMGLDIKRSYNARNPERHTGYTILDKRSN